MAKGSNIITDKLSGKLGTIVFVRSGRYGQHVRSARGTIKPAVLNEEMEASSKRMALANVPSKAIFNAVRCDHKDGGLWNTLNSIFRRQLKAGIPFHIKDLKNLECHRKCRLDKLIAFTEQTVRITEKGSSILVELFMQMHPDWSYLEWRHAFQYRLSVIAVFPDLATGHFTKETVHGPVTDFALPVASVSFEVPVPASVAGRDYLLFLLADVHYEEKMSGLARTKGMRVVGLGRLKNGNL